MGLGVVNSKVSTAAPGQGDVHVWGSHVYNVTLCTEEAGGVCSDS